MRRTLVFLAKCVVSAALIGFLLTRISLTEITEAMREPRWGWLVAAFLVYGLSAFGGALQWSWLLQAAGIRAAGGEIRRLYFIGLFFNNFLPANVGGDAWKIVDLGRQEKRSLGVFCATLLDRLLGLTALTLLAVLVLLAAAGYGISLPPQAWWLIPIFFLLGGGLAFLLSRRLGRLLPAAARFVGWAGGAEKLARVTGEFARYRERVAWLNAVLAFSVGVQFLRIATHVLVAWGLGFELGGGQVGQLFVLIPLLAISLTLPITINGIGLRESISAELLTWGGLLAGPQAVAMEVAAYLVQVVFSLQGGVLLWLGRWRRRGDVATEAGNSPR